MSACSLKVFKLKQLVIWTHSLEEFQLEVKISFLLILLSRHSSKRIYISIFFPIVSFAYLSLLWTCCDVMVHAIHCDLVFISISSHPYNLPSTMQNMQCTFLSLISTKRCDGLWTVYSSSNAMSCLSSVI